MSIKFISNDPTDVSVYCFTHAIFCVVEHGMFLEPVETDEACSICIM